MIAKHHFKQGNFAAVMLALCASILLFVYGQWQSERNTESEIARRAAALPDQWMVVRNVAVPDFVEGTDPLITYSREIRKPFIGEWLVEVHQAGSADTAPCYGSGRNRYEVDEVIPEGGVLLSWFIGTKCSLPPGKYILDTTWTILADGYPPKEIRYLSNPFTVLPKGGQLFLTPEQAQRLDGKQRATQ
jgi:hypothetical protein